MEESERIPQSSASSESSEKPLRSRPHRVCIVGAGVAGLSAAEALVLRSRETGIDLEVQVFEAMDRPGGRAVTLSFAGGMIEGGAQWIHGCQGNAVYQRAKEHSLEIADKNGMCITRGYTTEGKQVPLSLMSEVSKLYNDVIIRTQVAAYEEERKKSGKKSVGGFVKWILERYYRASSGNPQEKQTKVNLFRMFTLMEICYSACNNLHDLMLRDFGEYVELIGNVRLENGYTEFVNTFLANLPPGTVQYRKPVQQIVWNCHKDKNKGDEKLTDQAIIITADGNQFQADYVIVTASLGFLKENANTMFSPALPKEKLALIDRMGFGTTLKVWLEYETPFWSKGWTGFYTIWDESPSDILDLKNKFKEEEWYKHMYGIRLLPNNPRVLIAWLSGKAAEYVETLDNGQIAATITDQLRLFLKNPTIPLPTNIHKTGWYSNPYVRGSYSYVAAGSEGADIDRLAEPIFIPGENGAKKPLICFAGEATHRTFYSTTHGALLSGEREAERILADIHLETSLSHRQTNESS